MATAFNANKSSSYLKALFENATVGILVTDISGKIIAINPFALNVFGYNGNELMGKMIETLIPRQKKTRNI